MSCVYASRCFGHSAAAAQSTPAAPKAAASQAGISLGGLRLPSEIAGKTVEEVSTNGWL